MTAINGQAINQLFYVLSTPPASSLTGFQPAFNSDCKYYLPALAQVEPDDDHKNDRHSVIWFFDDLFTEAHMYLQKNIGGAWADMIELTDETYGTMYDLGFFVNKFGERALGYQLEWSKVLSVSGAGIYRIRNSAVKSIGSYPDEYSFEFELKIYSDDNADGTVRMEWNRNGVLGNRDNDQRVDDYGSLDWYNSIRVPNSIFGFGTSELTKEFIRYPNGQQQWLTDSQEEELVWNIYQLPGFIHRFVQVDIMQSAPIVVNDYNVLAPTYTVDRQVVAKSGYKPEWGVGIPDQKANVSITFIPYYSNLTHKRE